MTWVLELILVIGVAIPFVSISVAPVSGAQGFHLEDGLSWNRCFSSIEKLSDGSCFAK